MKTHTLALLLLLVAAPVTRAVEEKSTTKPRIEICFNTLQCGSMAETTPIWREIAKLSEGGYAAIPQDGQMQVVETPMDAELAKLNREMGATLVPYGSASVQAGVRSKQAFAESVSAPAAADRLAYNASTGKAGQGEGDLLDSLKAGNVTLEKLDRTQLPGEFKKLDKAELETRINALSDEREKVAARIRELSAKRAEFLRNAERKGGTKGDSFDEKVAQMLRKQGASKGIRY